MDSGEAPEKGSTEARLLALFRTLPAADQAALLRFAEFLAAQSGGTGRHAQAAPAVPEPPREIPRPERESVIQALRRLRETYPMLDRRELLGPASELVTRHTMYGDPAEEVIEALEQLYRERYRDYRKRFSGEEA